MKKLTYSQLQALFKKYKETGDEQAFREIYEATARSQYFIAYNYLNDATLAQEAVQNMYIAFVSRANSIKNDMGIVKWMNSATINMCKSLITKESLNKKVDIDNFEDKIIDTNLNPEDTYRRNEEVSNLNIALNKLDPTSKEIIIYRYVDNLKVKEISKLTDLSTATINRYIKKATMKLRKYLENLNNKMYGLVISPVMFKLFDRAMKAELPDKQLMSTYGNIAKNTAIAGSTIAVGAVSGKAAAGAAKKAGTTIARKSVLASTKVAGGAAATVATTAVVAAVAVSPTYSINMYQDGWVVQQTVSLESNDYGLISNVYCYQDDNLIGELNESNDYSLEIDQNGEYKLVIKDLVGKTQEETITINNIDHECPIIDNIEIDGNNYKAYIADTKSGIDFNNISITDQDGNSLEYLVDQDYIYFPNSSSTTKLKVVDKMGNAEIVVIYS